MITVGYGDILPKSPYEMVFSCFSMLRCCGVFGYSVNEIGAIFNDLSRASTEMKKNMQVIN